MIDLHLHSRISDGSDSPEKVVQLAKSAGCSHIALTDHDRLDGVELARAKAKELEIGFIPGVEISCIFPSGTFHLLAYYLEPGEGQLQERLIDIQAARTKRNEEMATKLIEAKFPISWEELMEEAGGPNLGRPHFAAVMVRKGVVDSIQEAFDKYLAKGKQFYVPKVQLTPKEAIALTLASGALPVLAHPQTLSLSNARLSIYISELADLGLVGMESYYSRYREEDRIALARLAEERSLVATGGSDYHGTYKTGLLIGSGEGDLVVPDEIVRNLEARRS